MNNFRFTNGRWRSAAALQWAPTLTFHDPNPPMTLESVAEPPAEGRALAPDKHGRKGIGLRGGKQ